MENKIDFVIIWVDGNDPKWQKEKRKYDTSVSYNHDDSIVRYRDWDNLQYWFRGVEKFAPWVNKIYFVTWGHLPPWLDVSNDKLVIVKHEDYIDAKYLPTFNTRTIELNLHKIKGLSEQFVYFNDDYFITSHVKAEDFFYKGLPKDTFAINTIYFGKNSVGHANGSNMEVINTHFEIKKQLKRNFFKYFSFKNGMKSVTRTTLLSPWSWFSGFYYQHLASNYLKSTFVTVWEKEYDCLNESCLNKFRHKISVNQWVFKFWQLADGKFYPKSPRRGKCHHIETEIDSVCKDIESGKYQLMCINDTEQTTDFEKKAEKVKSSFNVILSEKSRFEI